MSWSRGEKKLYFEKIRTPQVVTHAGRVGLDLRTTTLWAVIAGAGACVLAADMLTPLGIAVWVFYLIPVLLSFLLRQMLAPLVVATGCTLLVAIGFTLSNPGIDSSVAIVNRALGITTIWAMAGAALLFIRSKLAIEQQEWLQSSRVALSDSMGGEQGLEELADGVLRHLARQLGAGAGVLYVRNGVGFQRRATFAAPAEVTLPERLMPGEGLLGAAIKERRTTTISALEDHYLRYGSALGSAKPRTLLAAPILVDGEPIAAIELAFHDQNADRATALLEQVGTAIGVALRSAEFRARLAELLEETRGQADELQRQGEELRASNEGLEEQSRALQASQALLEEQQRKLEAANVELEERARALEAQRSDLERSDALLRTQTRELEQASRYKSEFLANMSHELRTPLNSSLIMARLLAENRSGTLTDEQVRFAETIEASGNDLLTLINDILDLSKIEAGHVDVCPEPVRLDALASRLERTFDPVAQGKGIGFSCRIAPGAPESIETDSQRIEQVLRNFVSNAVKFTQVGEVAVEFQRRDDGHVAISVSDTGIGIAPEQQEAIFEAFRQADGTTARRFGGTGLGLSISRELARLLGGRIELASTPEKGSTFTLVLPTTFAASEARRDGDVSILRSPPPAAPAQVRSRVQAAAAAPQPMVADDRDKLTGDTRLMLIVEDDPEFAKLLLALVRERGLQALVASTADEGVAMARQYMPHAIVLDVGLPDHSGMSVLDRLKHNVQTRHIPIHMVSAHDYSEVALAQGAVSYIIKPTKREQLLAMLGKVEKRFERAVRRVLVVEDDDTQRNSVRELLAADNVETVGVASGAECLEQLASITFDCLVLDLSLPDMTGFELLDRMSADEDRSFPPVIVYTGRDLTADEELQLRRYSRSIIVKGARSPDRLLDEVTLFLHQIVAELPGEKQRALARAHARDAAIEGRRILVVEDDIRNVFSLTSIFEPHGAEVAIARNGHEALRLLETAEEAGTLPDLILMDVMMPEMDGLEATRAIREKPGLRSLPVIMLTAKVMAGDQQECLDAGANDYMAKPLDVEKLLSLVRVWLPRR